MKRTILMLVIAVLLLAGCSSVKVVPDQVANGRINPADNSQTITVGGVEVSVRMDETSINSYNLDNIVTAFGITIKNGTESELAFSDDSYVLVDETGLQYSVLSPENVRAMLKKDSYYLVPYPYVGFYYLEDFEKTAANNRHSTYLPYYYDMYPQDLFTKALQPVTIIPGMKVEGLTYFKIDPTAHQQLKLLVYRKGASKSAPSDFSFPFKVIK